MALMLGEKFKVTLLVELDCKVELDEIMAVEYMFHEKAGENKYASALNRSV